MLQREFSSDQLMRFVGPPMRQGFRDIAAMSDPDEIEKAVALYRHHYDEKGAVFEYSVYPGIVDCLSSISSAGWRSFVVTSKMDLAAAKIIEHAGFSKHFVKVYGPNRAGEPATKAELIKRVLEEQDLSAQDVVMIGDRKYDVLAALAHQIPTVGVTYGFGSNEELSQAGVVALCESAASLQKFLLQNTWKDFFG